MPLCCSSPVHHQMHQPSKEAANHFWVGLAPWEYPISSRFLSALCLICNCSG